MEVKITRSSSVIDAMRGLYMSKRSYNEKIENNLERWGDAFITHSGGIRERIEEDDFEKSLEILFRIGQMHTTLLRFIDITAVVTGLHRGAVDDFDSHAKRLENRIIRSSTRLADYKQDEMSDWYKDKILTMEDVLENDMDFCIPSSVTRNGVAYVKTTNGYVREDLQYSRDVKRGLYMLSIPMNFTFKVNLVELAHIYRERGKAENGANGKAAPELQEMIEMLMDELQKYLPMVTREYLLGIRN